MTRWWMMEEWEWKMKERKFGTCLTFTASLNKSLSSSFSSEQNHYIFHDEKKMEEKHNFPLFSCCRLHRSSFVVLCNSKIIKGEEEFLWFSMRRAFNKKEYFSFKIHFGSSSTPGKKNMCKIESDDVDWIELHYNID